LEKGVKKMKLTKLPLEAWSTLIPDPLNIPDIIKPKHESKTTAAELDTVSQKQVKAVNDTTWLSMNEAGLQLMKQTIVNQDMKKAVEPLNLLQKEEKKEIAKEIQTKKVQKKTKRLLKPNADNDLNEKETKQIKRITVPPLKKIEHFQIATIEEHNQRDNEFELFKSKMPIHKNTNNVLLAAPPINKDKVLAYCASYKHLMPWYSNMNNIIANTDYAYPDVLLFSRKVLITFLFEPSNGERPCINLDYEPKQVGHQFRCVGHRLSEQKLGKGKGFRLKEMILETKPSIIPEMCYLCHLWFCLHDSIQQRDKLDERTKHNLSDQYKEHITILNKFMVYVDQPGEYDRTKMLLSDKVDSGIWGNIPLFNENNYVCVKKDNLRGFEETDNLLFHPTQVASGQTVSL